jgi:hypothetical protein
MLYFAFCDSGGQVMARTIWVMGLVGAALAGALGLAWKSSTQDMAAHAADSGSGTRTLPPLAEVPAPPRADPDRALVQTAEQRRMGRYDKDDSGSVSRDEFLASRQKAFAKLDVSGDGKLSFDEYAVKTIEKFGKADGNSDGALSAAEMESTAQKRAVKKAAECPPDVKAED